jgi:hypothetical protein
LANHIRISIQHKSSRRIVHLEDFAIGQVSNAFFWNELIWSERFDRLSVNPINTPASIQQEQILAVGRETGGETNVQTQLAIQVDWFSP